MARVRITERYAVDLLAPATEEYDAAGNLVHREAIDGAWRLGPMYNAMARAIRDGVPGDATMGINPSEIVFEWDSEITLPKKED